MLTTSDRQPFYCQNTFYKQFISVYKFKNIYTFTQDLKTNPGPVSRPPPPGEEATNWSNSDIRTLIKIFKVYPWYPKNFPSYSKSRDHPVLLTSHLMILINCFAACSARQFSSSHNGLLSIISYSGLGWLLFTFRYLRSTLGMSAYSCTHLLRFTLQVS